MIRVSFLIKLHVNFIKKIPKQVFFKNISTHSEFCEIYKKTSLYGTPRMATSENSCTLMKNISEVVQF